MIPKSGHRFSEKDHAPTKNQNAVGEADNEVTAMAERYVKADPYPWPYNGDLRPQNTALIIIDMQTDFCGVGGYVDKMG
jgi:hypothetical protein